MTSFDTFFDGNKHWQIRTSQILSTIQAVVATCGKDTLGYSAKDVGTRSICSSAAMSTYLAGVLPIYTVMLLGCWSSDAFLRYYIWRQVQEFSSGFFPHVCCYQRPTTPSQNLPPLRIQHKPHNITSTFPLEIIMAVALRQSLHPLLWPSGIELRFYCKDGEKSAAISPDLNQPLAQRQ